MDGREVRPQVNTGTEHRRKPAKHVSARVWVGAAVKSISLWPQGARKGWQALTERRADLATSDEAPTGLSVQKNGRFPARPQGLLEHLVRLEEERWRDR
jgi:hypothetical protein